LLPISRRSHLAGGIATSAGALLPHPFTPYLSPGGPSAGLLSVVDLRRGAVTSAVPLLTVSQGDLCGYPHEESGSSSDLAASDDLPSDTRYHTMLLLGQPIQHGFGALLEKAQIAATQHHLHAFGMPLGENGRIRRVCARGDAGSHHGIHGSDHCWI
jgi:hypothetical protein